MKTFKYLILCLFLFSIGCGHIKMPQFIDTSKQIEEMDLEPGGTKIRAFTALTGGGTGALDKISSSNLTNLDSAIVITASSGYLYTYDSSSSAAESSPDVIRPDDLPSTGRWLLVSSSSGTVEDDVYSSGWDSDTDNAPSQNAIYDYLHYMDSDDDHSLIDESWFDITNLSATNWRMFYSGAGGIPIEFVLGADGTFLESNGADQAPAFRSLLAGDIPDISATYLPVSAFTVTGGILVGTGSGIYQEETGGTFRTSIGLGNVENTALSTWTGNTYIISLGTIGTGVWQGTVIDEAYLDTDMAKSTASQSTDNLLVRTDGTGNRTVQDSGITVDDSNNVSGVASIVIDANSNPGVVFNDADAPGSEAADKEIGSLKGQYVSGTEDAENGKIDFYVHDAGTATEYMSIDGSTKTVELANTNSRLIATLNATPDDMSDHGYNGLVIQGINHGETVGALKCVFLASDGKVDIADADASGEYPAFGLTLNGGNDTDAAIILTKGIVRDETWTGLTVGGVVYLSDDGTGSPTQTAPSTEDDCVQVIGRAISDSEIYFNFTNHYVLEGAP